MENSSMVEMFKGGVIHKLSTLAWITPWSQAPGGVIHTDLTKSSKTRTCSHAHRPGDDDIPIDFSKNEEEEKEEMEFHKMLRNRH
jgi:hypothetical protein